MEKLSKNAYKCVFFYAAMLGLIGILLDSPQKIAEGFHNIFYASNILITDYFVIAGIGATFLNAAVITFISALLLYYNKLPMHGGGLVTIGLMSGFSFFGKNIFNMWFILLGTYLYCLLKKEKFSRHLVISLLSTALSPLISSTFFTPDGAVTIKSACVSVLCGLIIGFVMPMLAVHTERLLHGLNLYNGGFAIGLLGLILVPILKSYGFDFAPVSYWGTGYNITLGIVLYLIFASMILFGFCKNPSHAVSNYRTLLRRPGSPKDDFIRLDGIAAVLINMGVNGALATTYILLIGGDLNGPTLGGILTIVGFSTKGKHAKNILPVMLGVYLGGISKMWSLTAPAAQLAALFGTTLAPVAGTYGTLPGILAGFLHSSVVLHAGLGYSGVNLYNNGFAGGIVSIVMYSVLSAFLVPNTFQGCTEKK